MKLLCFANYKTLEGLFYIEVKINNSPKIHAYILNSEFYKRKFDQFYKKTVTHGRALKILQEGNINKRGNMRKRKLDQNIIRVGDQVKIINPEFFIRCGYDNSHGAACEYLNNNYKKQILQFIYNVEKLINGISEHNDKLYQQILSAFAYERVGRLRKEGEERKIFTERDELYLGNIFTVKRIFFCQTGKYAAPFLKQDYLGDLDNYPGRLKNMVCHKILQFDGYVFGMHGRPEITCIEACNVEKVSC